MNRKQYNIAAMLFFLSLLNLAAVAQGPVSQDVSFTSLQGRFNDFMIQAHTQFGKGGLKGFEALGGSDRYFSGRWLPGSATNPADVIISTNYEFNFDFKEHELYAQWKDTAIVVDSKYLKSFVLIESGIPHYFIKAPAIDTRYFFESIGYNPELKTSAVQLLKLRTLKLKKADKNSYVTNFNGDYSDEYKNVVIYYILLPNNSYAQVKLTQKSLLGVLAGHKDKVEAFFEVNDTVNEQNAGALIRSINQ